jgi:hypothetical protein
MAASSSSGGTQSSETGGSGGRGGAATSGGSAGRGGTTSSGGSSTTTGGSGGSAPAESAGEGGEGGAESTGEGGVPSAGTSGAGAVPSGDGYPTVPPSVCTDAWVDFDCDGAVSECTAPDVISFDAERNANCPVCAPPPAGARSCEKAQREYRAFLATAISASCANYCETDQQCAAWEITNSCGTVALSLLGGIDEEPIFYAEQFAANHCGDCGEVPQTGTLRRAGSPVLEFDPSTGLLDDLGPRCVSNQCVLAPL